MKVRGWVWGTLLAAMVVAGCKATTTPELLPEQTGAGRVSQEIPAAGVEPESDSPPVTPAPAQQKPAKKEPWEEDREAGIAAFRRGDYLEAVELLQEAARFGKGDAELARYLAQAAERTRSVELASKTYQKASALMPADTEIREGARRVQDGEYLLAQADLNRDDKPDRITAREGTIWAVVSGQQAALRVATLGPQERVQVQLVDVGAGYPAVWVRLAWNEGYSERTTDLMHLYDPTVTGELRAILPPVRPPFWVQAEPGAVALRTRDDDDEPVVHVGWLGDRLQVARIEHYPENGYELQGFLKDIGTAGLSELMRPAVGVPELAFLPDLPFAEIRRDTGDSGGSLSSFTFRDTSPHGSNRGYAYVTVRTGQGEKVVSVTPALMPADVTVLGVAPGAPAGAIHSEGTVVEESPAPGLQVLAWPNQGLKLYLKEANGVGSTRLVHAWQISGSSSLKTARGIGTGATEQAVVAAYGEPVDRDGGVLTYRDDIMDSLLQISFRVENGRVVAITAGLPLQ
jgi:hypothetical protein